MTTDTAPIVLISPAMAVPARFYRPLVAAFAEHGWPATVVARRGIEPGDSPPSRAEDWSYADEAADLTAAVRAARAAMPDRYVVLLGHSLGAHLAAMVANASDDGAPDGVVTVAASVPFFRDYPHGGVVEWAIAAAVPIVTGIVGHWPTPGFGAPAPRTLMRQWARMVRRRQTPFDGDAKVQVPTLAIRLDADRLVTPAAAREFERTVQPDSLTVWTYTADRCPPGGSVDHVRWVRTPRPVVERAVDWWRTQAGDRKTSDRARRNVSSVAYTMPSAASPIIEA
ncbi:serine aminopeptidase domain-containing protein [Gordonia insulae]|uniref:Serine aminopeptidase S33 domain-containing protein n=1 Tax=Gordonia insulae TaxID=2420509 RepID=A0A3G8JII8_9ACTN|nr:alpha/beta hydrolase [Gordonia insulae]AZG44405.1 hypothetical protein D7316_00990 [Gordonia insulae]